MAKTITIGKWIERESRDVTQCPSHYAADHETLRTKPAEYDARLRFEGGYTVPMPYWLLVTVEADRIDGRMYSGFGGRNFASEALPKEPRPLLIQMYHYHIPQLVNDGRLRLNPGFEWLLTDTCWQHQDAPKTWADIPSDWTR